MKQLTRRHFLKAAGAAVIAAACGVYEFIPGTKSLVGQAVKTTKATAAHYNLTSAVDAAKYPPNHHGGQQYITHDHVAVRIR
ncbi:twin-arginine translocation signal domain-containing protein [Anaeroglobus geminatus]|uniref:twin-arginine translocation signal domain-containing protein n=1 Tax=Anaeroglobus geminatus TaxID=156456 RepID=UPI0003136310|nr:twin-arginine translocation signal domain-containing protein [Anaeroglobus geminatus]